MLINAATAFRTNAQLLQLDAIEAYADAILALNPMDTDRPHIHYGVRALVARVAHIVNALYWTIAGHERARDLTPLLLGTYAPANQRGAAYDLIGEFDGIGAAIVAVIKTDERGMTNRHLEALACVERLRGIAGCLSDELSAADDAEAKQSPMRQGRIDETRLVQDEVGFVAA